MVAGEMSLFEPFFQLYCCEMRKSFEPKRGKEIGLSTMSALYFLLYPGFD